MRFPYLLFATFSLVRRFWLGAFGAVGHTKCENNFQKFKSALEKIHGLIVRKTPETILAPKSKYLSSRNKRTG